MVKFTDQAVTWSFTHGRWFRIDGARPPTPERNGQKAKPGKTEADLRRELPLRVEIARRYGTDVVMVVTSDGKPPDFISRVSIDK